MSAVNDAPSKLSLARFRDGRLRQYGFAAAVTLAAFLITWMVPPLRHFSPYILLIAAVVFSAFYGGLGPGLLSTVLGLVLVTAFITAPHAAHFLPTAVADLVRLGVFLLLAVLISSLTESRRRAEERLRLREQHFRTLLENTSDIVTILDATGAVRYQSPSIERVFGYKPAEMVGRSVLAFVHPDDLPPVRKAMEAALAAPGEPISPVEARIRTKDGSWRTIEAVGKNLLQQDPVAGLVIHSRDITDRKQLVREQAARMEAEAARRRFHDLVEGLDAIVWEADPQTGQFTFVSRRAEQMLGYPLSSWLDGADWTKHVYPEDRARVLAALHAPARPGGTDCEYRALTLSGRLLWLRLIVYGGPGESGDVRQLRGLIVDVTERHQSDAALRHSERLAATGRLAASIAHEINNPLAAVTNLMYLLENLTDLNPSAREYARLAQDELRRMSHITRQMLGFYRDSDNPAKVNIPDILDSVLDLYHRKLQNSGVKLVRRYDDAPPVLAYPGEIRQVFSNVLLNAVDAIGRNGQITIHVHASPDWRDVTRRGARIVFADNGPGIRHDILQHIFEPFFTTKGQKGTGLGLWVSQGIVQKHQGTIRVHSVRRPGRTGTAFSIFLPEAEPQTSAAGAGSAA